MVTKFGRSHNNTYSTANYAELEIDLNPTTPLTYTDQCQGKLAVFTVFQYSIEEDFFNVT